MKDNKLFRGEYAGNSPTYQYTKTEFGNDYTVTVEKSRKNVLVLYKFKRHVHTADHKFILHKGGSIGTL